MAKAKDVFDADKQLLAFNVLTSPIGTLFHKIKTEDMGRRDIAHVRDWFDSINQHMPILLSDNAARYRLGTKRFAPKAYRANKNYLTNLGNLSQPFLKAYRGKCIYIHISPTTIALSEREMPITISNGHLQRRFTARAAPHESSKLSYDHPDFKFSMLSALALLKALQRTEFDDFRGYGRAPIVIPHPAGLFMGFINKIDPSHTNPTVLGACREQGNLTFYETSGTQCINVDWTPNLEVTFTTFIGQHQFHPDQEALHKRLMTVFSSDNSQIALTILDHAFGSGCIERFDGPFTHISELHQSALESLDKDLSDIIDSNDWTSNMEAGWKAIEKNPGKYNYPVLNKATVDEETRNYLKQIFPLFEF